MNNETNTRPDNLVAKSGLFSGMNAFMAIASMAMILAFVGFTIQDVEYTPVRFLQKVRVLSSEPWTGFMYLWSIWLCFLSSGY